jgi:hypothetical protein
MFLARGVLKLDTLHVVSRVAFGHLKEERAAGL